MFASLVGRRAALLLGLILVGAVSLAAVRLGTRAPGERTQPPPVVLVPGYLGSAETMSALQGAVERSGRAAVVVELPRLGTGEILSSARALDRAVVDLGAPEIDIVGFSVGGIVVRAWVERLGRAGRVRRVVLLGAPNHGARIADLAASLDPALCAGACAQLAPGSSFLRRLNPSAEANAYTNIWTEQDATVTPPRSARLAGALNVSLQAICGHARLGHGDLLSHRLALGAVVLALGGRLDEGATRCGRALSAGRAALGS